jgi:hypothetical protein
MNSLQAPPEDGNDRNDSEPPEESKNSRESDQPITPDELGLSPDFKPEFIPTLSDLQRAAIEGLDREIAFVILNQDEPAKIVERLDKIADVARAASQVKGEHRAKAIRLGLELRQRYWLAANKIDAWVDLIMPLMEAALDLEDRELQSRVYHAWSVYLYIARDRPTAVDIALEAASDYAEESGRADLKLLAQAERFNARVLKMSLPDAQAEADVILAEARRMKYDYVQGRAYLSLARAFAGKGLDKDIFACAQQALVFFVSLDVMGFAGESVNLMLGGLSFLAERAPTYPSQLMAYLDKLSQRSANPILQAALSYYHAVQQYHLKNYERAREYILLARRKYTAAHYRPTIKRCAHVLGLIQTKRGQWKMAERHLTAAYTYYKKAGEDVNAVQAYYALAFIPYEQSDWKCAKPLLEKTREMAEALPDAAARDKLVKSIQDDIDEIDRRLPGGINE